MRKGTTDVTLPGLMQSTPLTLDTIFERNKTWVTAIVSRLSTPHPTSRLRASDW